MSLAKHIANFAADGRYTFTTEQAHEMLGGSGVATLAALRRLKAKGEITTPVRGFHVIVPPEYRRLGCLPAAEFVPELMAFLGAPYYAGLLTAAEIHGAAHHKPQVFQVVTSQNRRPIVAGLVRIELIAKAKVAHTPTFEKATDRGYLRVSTPEATAFDLVTYLEHAGGLDNVATVLAELAEKLDTGKLIALAQNGTPVVATQRLGYLLEVGGNVDLALPLASLVKRWAPPVAPLRPGRASRGAPRDRNWRLALNATVEMDV